MSIIQKNLRLFNYEIKNNLSIIFLFFLLLSCSESNNTCEKSFQILENPRLDVIADDLADLRAKIANGNGTQEDSQKIYRLQAEEDAIWKNSTNTCR